MQRLLPSGKAFRACLSSDIFNTLVVIPTKQEILTLLEFAPGPLPWYGLKAGNQIHRRESSLQWMYQPNLAASLLVEAAHEFRPDCPVFGIGKTYTYAKSLSPDHFALWWQERGYGQTRSMQFRVFETAELRPLSEWESSWTKERETWIGAPPVASFSLPPDLADGIHPISFPAQFASVAELFLIVNRKSNGFEFALWNIYPADGTLSVIPQRWWNEGQRDFDYEWITRVAREEKSGLIVGDGIRVTPFILDTKGRELITFRGR